MGRIIEQQDLVMGVTDLRGTINDSAVYGIMADIDTFDSNPSVNAILLQLTTHGGNNDSTAALLDYIQLCPKDIFTLGIGKVYSSGTSMLQAGRLRFVTPRTRVMVHLSTINTTGMLIDSIEKNIANWRAQENTLLELCTRRSGLSLDEIKKIIGSRDYYLNGSEITEFGPQGLADHVVSGRAEVFPFVRDILSECQRSEPMSRPQLVWSAPSNGQRA